MQHIKNDPKVALKLFLYFFKIGWFTFGGGFSILAQMQKDFVEKQHLVDEQTMLDQASIGRSLPGLMVANVAYLFGYSQGGLLAGVASVIGITIPLVVWNTLQAQLEEKDRQLAAKDEQIRNLTETTHLQAQSINIDQRKEYLETVQPQLEAPGEKKPWYHIFKKNKE